MNFSEILDKRRAVNFFDPDRDVPEDLLRAVVEDAARAPSGFNLQPWRLLVLRDQEIKQKVRAVAWDQPKITEAPVVLAVLADRNGWKSGNETFEKIFEDSVRVGRFAPDQHDTFAETTKGLYGTDPERELAFAVKNTAFFAMSLMYAACNRGLQTHPMDGFDYDAVKTILNVPDNFWIPLLLAVGYLKPEVAIRPQRWRKNYDEIVTAF